MRITLFLTVMFSALADCACAQGTLNVEIVPQIQDSRAVTSVAFSPDGFRVLAGDYNGTLRLWDLATGAMIRTFVGHSASVNAVVFSRDGTRVLSGGSNALSLWDTASGVLLRNFEGHSKSVSSVAFSADGKRVLSASQDRTVKLWDAATGALIRSFERDDPYSGLSSVAAFSPDGKRVLAEGRDPRIWDVETGALIQAFSENSTAAFSPDGSRRLTGSKNGPLKLWDVASGTLLRTFEGHSGRIASLAFSADGGRILSGSEDRTLKLWDTATGALLRTFDHTEYVTLVSFSPDGTRVVSGSYGRTLKLWDTSTGALLHTFEGQISHIAFSPDGTRLLLDGTRVFAYKLALFDAATGALVRGFEGHSSSVTSVSFSPDGTSVLTGGFSVPIKLWDGATGALIRTFGDSSDWASSAAFSPDGNRVLSGGNTLKLWDAGTAALIRTFEKGPTPNRKLTTVAFSPDGARVVSGVRRIIDCGPQCETTYVNTLEVWDARTGELIKTIDGRHRDNSDSVSSVMFSPDGKRLISAGSSEKPELWNIATGALLRSFVGHSWPAHSATFSPDGTRVLAAGYDQLKLWDAASGVLLRTFQGHSDSVSSVVFSPDGSRILSGGSDKTLKLWDTTNGALLRTFQGHLERVFSVAFSPDGTRVLSGSADGTVRFWSLASGQPLASLIAGRDREWLTMTPAGFFASSRKGTEILGIVRGLEVITMDQIHQSLFNPDLLREALAGDPSGEAQGAAKVINLEKVVDSGPAPIVAIKSHASDSQSAVELLTVKARITDKGKGIGRIEWRVNGITAAVSTKPRKAGPEYDISQQLALDPGKNSIELVAYNASNVLASLPARVTVEFTGSASTVKPKLHVLAIGINAYIDRGWRPPGQTDLMAFPPLALAAKDATTFGDSMKRAAGGLFAEVRLTTLLDAQATRDKLGKAIAKLAVEIHPRDTFILFAAAHGKSEAGRFYLIPQDYDGGTNPDALAKRAIDQGALQDWLANRIKAKKAVILLDTCESGALVGGALRSRTDTPASEAALGRLHEATGRPVLTAAAEGNPAFEGYEGHGVFTWALLDALRNGDRNGNGSIELSELVAHVQDQVPRIAAKLNGIGRAAIAVRGSTDGTQSARFGSRGEDFVLARRLQ